MRGVATDLQTNFAINKQKQQTKSLWTVFSQRKSGTGCSLLFSTPQTKVLLGKPPPAA
uniref:Uncharacterized protein n=1 Tax=Arundo donax TaxID=35708 RepID=A0A0A8YUT7_ARUDO